MVTPFSSVYICNIFMHANKYDCTELIHNSFFTENKVRGYPPYLQHFSDGPFGQKHHVYHLLTHLSLFGSIFSKLSQLTVRYELEKD